MEQKYWDEITLYLSPLFLIIDMKKDYPHLNGSNSRMLCNIDLNFIEDTQKIIAEN